MAGTYKNFLKLLESWPLDKAKPGRDLGQHIRDQVKVAFFKGEGQSQIDKEQCDKYYASLKRIALNHYSKLYPRTQRSSACGMTVEQCNLALSPDFQEYFQADKSSKLKKLKQMMKNVDAMGKKTSLSRPHIPVMAKKVIEYMKPSAGDKFVDMTFGAGGHTECLLQSAPDLKIYALDRDPVAHEYAKSMADKYPGQVIPLLGRFSELPELLKKEKVQPNSIDGFLFDFGCSSMQFDVGERGFSISKNGPLDMRMDGFRLPNEPTAADVIERASEFDLAKIMKVYGEEKHAKKIARAIVEARYTFKTLKTTGELARLVESVLRDDFRTDQLGRFAHCATKVFQAFRIFVNNELNEINYGMLVAERYLKINGRLITIAFHSLEDIVVKRHISGRINEDVLNLVPLGYQNYGKVFQLGEVEAVTAAPWKMLHPHVLIPSEEEIEMNPRSRSAKFRAIARLR